MIAPALDIGRTIKVRGYDTAVYKTDSCASACALIWMAGSKRIVFEGGRVGFHASYLDSNGMKLETGLGNALVGHYLSQLGFSERAVVFATLAPPEKILWLDENTASASGIEFTTIPAEREGSSATNESQTSAPPPISIVPSSDAQSDEPDVDYASQFLIFKESAEKGDKESQYYLATMYDDGVGVLQNDRQAVYWYAKSAEQGYADAQNNLGVMYLEGEGVTKDEQRALHWFKKAAAQGNAGGQFNVAFVYDNGLGVPQDFRQAVYWYRKSAQQGDVDAQYSLAVMYDNGEGVDQDKKQALYWYSKAAEQGNVDAQFTLGVMYDDGQGIPENDVQAVYWLSKAAEQGYAKAQFNLGMMHVNGEGVNQSDRVAVYWFKQAAEQNDARGQYNLGWMLANGRGVAKNDILAHMWFNLAAANGNVDAANNREVVASSLTSQQISRAQALAQRCMALEYKGCDFTQ